jgi:hypothetical protein
MARCRIKDPKILKKLNPPRNPEGGWLPPDPKKLQTFFDEMQEEAIRRFGVDEDNDACVIVRLVDCSREESSVLNFEPIPYEIEDDRRHPYHNERWNAGKRKPNTKKWVYPKHTPEEEETRQKTILEHRAWIRRMIQLNFSLASDRLQQMLREDEHRIREEIERPEKKRAERIKRLEHIKEYYGDPITYLRNSGYEVDEAAGLYWYKKDDGLDNGPRKKPIPVKPDDYDKLMEELAALKAYTPAKPLKRS